MKPELILTLIVDAGHAWMVAPYKVLEWLKIHKDISAYSYRQKDICFLEEDSDGPKLLEALNLININFKIKTLKVDRWSGRDIIPHYYLDF